MSSHVVVDGSNIATEGRNLPSLVQLDEAVRAFLTERPHDSCIVVVDATFEHRIDSSEKRMFDEAVAAGELVTPPAGTIGRGDKFLLEIAERTKATVFSNDSFQEFHGEYDWLFDEGRLVGGKPVPGVGWIFTARNPVRGAKSRMATQRAATKKRARSATGSSAKKAAKASPRSMAPEPEAPVTARGGAARPTGTARGARRTSPASEPVNAALPFIEFITEHPLGATVKGEVVEFTSHGAYVNVGDVRCYVGLRHLGNPPPRSAREVLTRGEEREFVVQALDAPRRGIDLALPGFERIDPDARSGAEPSTDERALSTSRRPQRRRPSSRPETADEPATAEVPPAGIAAAAQAPATAEASPTQSEAILVQQPAKKKAARTTKAAAKKATKKKVSAAKSTAKKSAKTATRTVKKASRKAAGTKATATRKAAGKKAAATRKKATATRKAAGKKAAVTRKVTAKKAIAKRKTAAKKSAATKAVKATKKAGTAVRKAVVKAVTP